jgi:hypothetical protein
MTGDQKPDRQRGPAVAVLRFCRIDRVSAGTAQELRFRSSADFSEFCGVARARIAMTLARWALTVRSAIPSASPICLLSLPATISRTPAFARGQPGEAAPQRGVAAVVRPALGVLLQRAADGVEQDVARDRFRREVGRPRPSSRAGGQVAMPRRKMTGRLSAALQRVLQFKPGGPGIRRSSRRQPGPSGSSSRKSPAEA